jgi:hypothetical protein
MYKGASRRKQYYTSDFLLNIITPTMPRPNLIKNSIAPNIPMTGQEQKRRERLLAECPRLTKKYGKEVRTLYKLPSK